MIFRMHDWAEVSESKGPDRRRPVHTNLKGGRVNEYITEFQSTTASSQPRRGVPTQSDSESARRRKIRRTSTVMVVPSSRPGGPRASVTRIEHELSGDIAV